MKIKIVKIVLFMLILNSNSILLAADKGLLIFAYAKDSTGNIINNEYIEVWKSEWNDYGKEDYAWILSKKYNGALIDFRIINPENYYLHYTTVNKDGIKKNHLARYKKRESIEAVILRVQKSIAMNNTSKTKYAIITQGFYPLKLRDRDELSSSSSSELSIRPLNRYANLLNKLHYNEGPNNTCPDGETTFNLHQEYSGIFKFTSNDNQDMSIGRLNMKGYFKFNKSEEKILSTYMKDLNGVLTSVCGNKNENSSIFNTLFNAAEGKMRSHIRKIGKENREKAYKKCMDRLKRHDACKAKLAHIGIRG